MSISIFLWFLISALIYLHATDSFDQDLGRHLKLGEIIWQEKQVSKTNLFSYTNPNEPVFNSHWGSQVIFYGVWRAFGINGLILLNAMVNTAAFGMLFVLAARRGGVLIPSILFIPFLFILLDRTWIRPEMFGNLFYALVLVALFVKKVRNRLKWFFPLIALLWINLHISAVFGVFAMTVVLVQDSFDVSKHQKLTNGGIFLLILVVLLINPHGLGGVVNAVTVLNKYGYTIVENQSWFFLRDYGGFPLVSHIFFGFFVLTGSFFMLLFRRRRPYVGELVLLLVISILTLRFVRNEVLFAYTAFLISSLNLAAFAPRKSYWAVVILLMAASVFLINQSHSDRGLPIGLGNRESYQKGVDFFLANNLQGPIFNNFDIGGYLIYRLYPRDPSTGSRQLVFVDNRPEAYPVAFFEEVYKPMQFDPKVFDEKTKQYGFRTIIWGTRDITPWSDAFLEHIAKNPNWQIAYIDDAMLILTKTPLPR